MFKYFTPCNIIKLIFLHNISMKKRDEKLTSKGKQNFALRKFENIRKLHMYIIVHMYIIGIMNN